MQKYKEYAVRFLPPTNPRRRRHLVSTDDEPDGDVTLVANRPLATTSDNLNSLPPSHQETFMSMSHWSMQDLIREVQSNPSVIRRVDAKGATLMHHAAKEGSSEVIEVLIDKGANIDAKDNEDNTPCHWAVYSNQSKALRILLGAGADVTLLNESKMAPIHVACDQNNPDMIEILASRDDFDPDLPGESGMTPVHYCAIKDSADALKKMLEYEPELCRTDDHMVYPVHNAAKHMSRKVLEILLQEGEKHGCSRETQFSFKDKENNTILHSAVNGGCPLSLKLCLEAGAPPDVKQDDGSTPLHLASSQGALVIAKLLVDADKTRSTLMMRDVQNMTPLHRAAMFDHTQVVEYLIDQRAEIDATDKNNRTALLLAISRGAWRAASFLIQKGASYTLTDDEDRNLIHLMVLSGGHINVLGDKLTEKEDMCSLINDPDCLGHTPMHYATRDGNIKSLQGLLEMGAKVEHRSKADKQSALHFAARYGRFNSCKRLLDSKGGRNVINDTDGKGMTAVHIAAWNGHSKVVQLLLLRGALLHNDHKGRTPFHLAAMSGYIDTMRVLLRTHAYLLDKVDSTGESALHVAAREGQVKSINFLLTAGARLSLNKDGLTVFDIVIEEKNYEVARTLVLHDRWHETLTNYSNETTTAGRCPVSMLIEHMPDVMMKVLDRSVTMSNNDPASSEFWINYDFRYLEPSLSKRLEYEKLEVVVPPLHALNDMVINGQEDLLSHPLCIAYLNAKWSGYGAKIHYGYMLIYILFVACFTSIITTIDSAPEILVIDTTGDDLNGTYEEITWSQTQVKHVGQHFALLYIVIFACANIIKEFVQMFTQHFDYFASVDNYFEWLLYVCTLLFAIPFWLGPAQHYQWSAGSIAIFYAWFTLLVYQERVDYIGIYVVMFNEILKTIIRVMAVFSVIIFAFGLAFYMIMSGEKNHAFLTPAISIARVFSMMMGELDFIHSFVEPLTDNDPATLHYSYMSFIFLVALVILLPILLMNLLIGLAVGDIAAVQQTARLKRLAMQVDIHTEYEPKLPTKVLQYVTKDNVTIWPNAEHGNYLLGLYEKIRKRFIFEEGRDGLQSLIKSKSKRDNRETDMEKLKQRVKAVSIKLDKQYDLVRLIVQKMEIHSEEDEHDEGDEPPGGCGIGLHGLRKLRWRMDEVVTKAVSKINTTNKDDKQEEKQGAESNQSEHSEITLQHLQEHRSLTSI